MQDDALDELNLAERVIAVAWDGADAFQDWAADVLRAQCDAFGVDPEGLEDVAAAIYAFAAAAGATWGCVALVAERASRAARRAFPCLASLPSALVTAVTRRLTPTSDTVWGREMP